MVFFLAVNGLSILTWPFLGHCPHLVCVCGGGAGQGRAGVAWGREVLTASQFSSLPNYLLKAPSPNTGTSEVRASAREWGDTSAHSTHFLLLTDYFDLGRWGVFLLQAACFLFFFLFWCAYPCVWSSCFHLWPCGSLWLTLTVFLDHFPAYILRQRIFAEAGNRHLANPG